MEIDRPQQPGYYVDRDFDCKRALRSAFKAEIHKSGGRFLDLGTILNILTAPAIDAGWTPQDVREAVLQLANDQQTADTSIHRFPGERVPRSLN